MDEIAPEYDVVVLGTGKRLHTPPPELLGLDPEHVLFSPLTPTIAGLTECVLSG